MEGGNMTKELALFGVVVGETVRCLNGGEDDVLAEKLDAAFGVLVDAVSDNARPDAERAALMLLSAGQRLYGSSDADQDGADEWHLARINAERLLGIVPLTNAE
jgi:hypothetical protein